MGINLRRLGRIDLSVKKLYAAVELQPLKAQAHNNLGLSLYENKEYLDAISSFTQAITFEKV